MAEGVIPFAAVMPQNEQVGAGVKQQEETQESAQGTNEDLFANGMNFWEVHVRVVFVCKITGFLVDGQIICFY